MFYFYVLVTIIVMSWLVVNPWFFALTRLKNMGYKANGVGLKRLFDELGWIVAVPLVIFIPLGALADILFNWTWGSAIYREFPREFFFTTRVKRHAANGLDYGWKQRINTIQPDHI